MLKEGGKNENDTPHLANFLKRLPTIKTQTLK